mgnify:CR=1 FL=1
MSQRRKTCQLSHIAMIVVKAVTDLIRRAALVSILAVIAAPAAIAAVPCEHDAIADARVDTVTVAAADGRTVPLEILHPAAQGKYPLVVFSHGAFASPDRYHALLKPVAAAGYIILAPRHLDSEDWEWTEKPSQAAVWASRGEDMALMLAQKDAISSKLAETGIEIDYDHIAALGHSYGALIAQIIGGARPLTPSALSGQQSVQAVVAFSPPGITPGLIDEKGWSEMTVPNLTITGTADILPGFINDWNIHKHSFDHAPARKRWLWVGDGIDHYFGGMFGREKPASDDARTLFGRALATTIAFLDQALGKTPPCLLKPPVPGELLTRDGTADE